MAGTSPGTASRLAQAVETAAPGHPLQDLTPLEHLLERDLTAQASARTAFSVLAVSALVLAAVGLYGVLAVGVGRQRRELAVRTALGATPGDLMRRVLGHGLGMVVAGCVAGLVLAYGSTRAVQSLLYGAPSWDPPALLVAAGFVASWIPARRAAKTQPASALREE
jgi:ABC-type antimicrobial peptide transport system permease subunit